MHDLRDLGALDDFVMQLSSVQSDDGCVDGVLDELLIAHQFVAGEGRHRLQKQLGSFGEIAHSD